MRACYARRSDRRSPASSKITAVIEVMLNPDGRLWIDRRSSGLADTGEVVSAPDGERIVRLVAHHVGAEVHASNPRVSAELPETGERFEGLLPPVVTAPAFAMTTSTGSHPSGCSSWPRGRPRRSPWRGSTRRGQPKVVATGATTAGARNGVADASGNAYIANPANARLLVLPFVQ